MKIVIIGGTGLIGSKVAAQLNQLGHTIIAGSPSTGINSITGEGIAAAMAGTDIVVDLSNPPFYEDGPVMDFFQTSGHNLIDAEIKAGIKHHLILSIVGADLMPNVGYMRAKKMQEDLIKNSGLPFTIIRSTQFMEFLPALASGAIQGNEAHASDVAFQPIAAEDVAAFVAYFILQEADNHTSEIAGPERRTLSEFIAAYLKANGSSEQVVANNKDEYYGGQIPHDALVPQGKVKLGKINFDQWYLSQHLKS